ncbi:MAG: alpha/beta hydrolase, partial [Oscillochloris sp.]|nr:alpha/beta hydrolase [Oscillochloris sp.]
GAWHGAWCWEPAMADFAARGFEVHAISLRGHGGSPCPHNFQRSSIVHYASDLRAAVRAVGPRPLIVAHSLGGLLLQLLITGILGPVPAIAGGVLLCSSPTNLGDYFTPRHYDEPITLSAMLRLEPQVMRAILFRRDIPQDELERYVSRMTPEPSLVTPSSMLLRPRPARCRTPLLVIAAEHDAVYGPDSQRANAIAYRCNVVIIPEATHDLMLDPAWPVAAEVIERFANQIAL